MIEAIWVTAEAGAHPQPLSPKPDRGHEDAVDERFQLALALVPISPDLAAPLLEALYLETGSIRVRLEYARALFFAERYAASRREFRAILRMEVPRGVQENVVSFLQRIDRRAQGPVSTSFALLYDANPANGIETQTVEIFGLDFTYEDPFYKPGAIGGGVTVQYARDLETGPIDQITLKPRFRVFPEIDYATLQVHAEASSQIGKKTRLQFGTSISADGESAQVATNYVGLNHLFQNSARSATWIGYQVGTTESLGERYSSADGYFGGSRPLPSARRIWAWSTRPFSTLISCGMIISVISRNMGWIFPCRFI